MGSKFGLEVIFFFLMFICISHYFFHYSIWDSLIFSMFSQCSSRINLISNFILKQIFLFIVVDFSLGCLILVDKKTKTMEKDRYFEALVLLCSFQKIKKLLMPFSFVRCWIQYFNFSYQQPNGESYVSFILTLG